MSKYAAAHKLQGRRNFRGLEISIENKKGSRRYWYDPHGKEKGSTLMHADYGYIRRTEGTDGDHVDVYLGPNEDAPMVYIINQVKKPEGSVKGDGRTWSGFDEQKCMLGFASAEAAKALYLKQYDDPRFFGSMKQMAFDEFASKVLDKENHGEKIANGDMLQYYLDHPDKAKAREERKKKEAQVSKSEQRRAALVAEQRSMGRGPTLLGGYPTKQAADPTVDQRADMVDNAGLAVLGAPAAVALAHHGLEHVGKGTSRLAEAAAALSKRVAPAAHWLENSAIGKHVPEIAGLALVSPTIAHGIARAVTPAPRTPDPQSELEPAKLAGAKDLIANPAKLVGALNSRLAAVGKAPVSAGGAGLVAKQLQRPGANVRDIVRAHASAVPLKVKGIEKMSDARSEAINASAHMLLDGLTSVGRRIPNLAAQSVGKATAAGKNLARTAKGMRGADPISAAANRVAASTPHNPALLRPANGPTVSLPSGGAANWRPAQAAAPVAQPRYLRAPDRMLANKPQIPTNGPTWDDVTRVGKKRPPRPVAQAPVATPAQAPVAPARPAAGPRTLTPGRIAGGLAVGLGGLGLYGGYRAIDTAANMMTPAHAQYAGPEPSYGTGRVY